jgi:hypothetical protein
MQNYAFARGSAPPRGPRREGPSDEGFVSLSFRLLHSPLTYNSVVTPSTRFQR